MANIIQHSSQSFEWFTPPEILDLAREVEGAFDLDPASCAEANLYVRAKNYYGLDKQDDGLNLPWEGHVWCNPPYNRAGIQWDFARRASMIERAGSACWLLVRASTDVRGFEALWGADALCFVRGRLRFGRLHGKEVKFDDPAPFPSVLAYYGRQGERAHRALQRVGHTFRGQRDAA